MASATPVDLARLAAEGATKPGAEGAARGTLSDTSAGELKSGAGGAVSGVSDEDESIGSTFRDDVAGDLEAHEHEAATHQQDVSDSRHSEVARMPPPAADRDQDEAER